MAEYEASDDLRAEFLTAEDYAAYTLATTGRQSGLLAGWKASYADAANLAAFDAADAAGRVRILGQ